MAVFYKLDELPEGIKNTIVTIGNFDGVHKGHQTIFKKVVNRASDLKCTSVAVTFEPHPVKIKSPDTAKPLITLLEQKTELIASQGIDIVLLINFTPDFSSISAHDFVKNILLEKLKTQEIVVGYDYVFGYNREGNIELLKKLGKQYDFIVHQVEPVYIEKTLVSSTMIRNLVMNGDVSVASKLLGRSYQIRGKVVKGRNRGASILGYPTANLEFEDELFPKEGVYIVKVDMGGKIYQALTNIGHNPTFKDSELSIETHILDFSENILGTRIKINFLSRLRDEISFSSVQELTTQINSDIKVAKDFFQENIK